MKTQHWINILKKSAQKLAHNIRSVGELALLQRFTLILFRAKPSTRNERGAASPGYYFKYNFDGDLLISKVYWHGVLQRNLWQENYQNDRNLTLKSVEVNQMRSLCMVLKPSRPLQFSSNQTIPIFISLITHNRWARGFWYSIEPYTNALARKLQCIHKSYAIPL